MGEKGAKASDSGQEAADALIDDLQPVAEITSKSMFGGHGVFGDGVMFAIVDSAARCFLRADNTTAPRYEAEGSARHSRMPYWEIPAVVRSDGDRLLDWAVEALDVAKAAKR